MIHGPAERLTADQIRFLDNRVENFQGCWIWMLSVNHRGYGLFSVGNVYYAAHRWGYEQFVGPIPDGLQLDHLCCRRDCVNPVHLEPVTPKENRQRAMRPYCKRGHRWTDETTYITPVGQRACIPCMRASTQRWRAARASRNV